MLARSKWGQIRKEARNRNWGWMDPEKKIKCSYKGRDSQFSMCMSTLWCYRYYHLIHLLCYRQLLTRPPFSSCPICVYICFSPLLLRFPPAWVNVRASCCSSHTVPWETDQPHRRGNPLFWLKEKGKGREERNFYASELPVVSSSPLVLVHCCTALNHVAKLPGFPVPRVEERRATITKEVTRDFLKSVVEILVGPLWDVALYRYSIN